MIKEVVVKGKEVLVYYESGRIMFYMKKEDLPKMMKGISILPKTVIEFMRKNPNKVR